MCPERTSTEIESGRGGEIPLDRIRRVFEAAGARARLTAWWHGAAADRLLDERHAALVERVLTVLARRRWETAVEVTFSEFGERGSIDILGTHVASRSVAVCEIKSTLGSLEETNRVLDVKVRLAAKLIVARFGWRPLAVSRLLIVPDDMTIRRTIERHRLTMARVYPERSRGVRAWLRNPHGPIAGIWFLSEV